MSALDVTGNHSVVLVIGTREVKRFDNLHRAVAMEKARASQGTWVPALGKLYKVTNVFVYDPDGNVELELTSPSQEPKEPFVCGGCSDRWCESETAVCVPDDSILADQEVPYTLRTYDRNWVYSECSRQVSKE